MPVGTYLTYLYMLNSVVISMVGKLGRGEERTGGEWEGESTVISQTRWGNNVF